VSLPTEPKHWSVAAMAAVIIKRRSVEWLAGVAEEVPEAHRHAFFQQLGSVAKELVALGAFKLSGDVIDLLVKLRSKP